MQELEMFGIIEMFIEKKIITLPMKSTCTLEIELPDEATAQNIAKALELDNAGYIETKVVGSTIFATTEAADIMSLRNTVDDYLACLTVAQKSMVNTE